MNPPLQSGFIDSEEHRRRAIVRLVKILFILLIFEGGLRKWVVPQLSDPLLFIRDPFLFVIYILAVQQKRIALNDILMLGLVLGLLLIFLAATQIAFNTVSAVVGGYGLRNYILYLPLPFVMYSNLRRNDIESLLLLLYKISVPLGILGVYQSFQPSNAWINQGVGDGLIFTTGNQARTYGTFSFTAGHGNYITFMFPLAAGGIVMFSGERKFYRWAMLSLVAMSSAAVTSGSRGVIGGVAITMSLYIVCILLGGGGKKSVQLFTSAILLLFISGASYLAFQDRFENIQERFLVGESAEGSVIERGLAPLTKLSDAISDGSIVGVGIGKGTGGGSYLSSGVQEFVLAEEETLRIIQECGAVVGTLYIAFRILLLVIIARFSSLSLQDNANPMPLMLLSYLAPSLLVGQITLNNTSNGFNWLGVGLCLCLTQIHQRRSG